MRIFLIAILSILALSAPVFADNGLVSVKSAHDVKETADRLEAVLAKKGMTIFARIDHAAGAEKAEMQLRPTELVIFGNPKVGTPLMLCDQYAAIDLPQKALIHEDAQGQVWFSYNSPAYLAERHQLEECSTVLMKAENALSNFAAAATQP
ncbi:DUF302 domain-containing protein [Neptunomonas qingdaonensis]|uniref:Uncharacterized conserved protein, DUF302 family n=1 Tax=Neptunomonas qingdaonensis TaxID=1045558 RepID=A0A1I2VR77_9GAMM|nr:DUF302 domain-containing protein [Neptunomonas qingdaonensis]SFG90817.1 Uncharacterized conserved protein, DUF302 family [Neptunomonas qingdaonensis]